MKESVLFCDLSYVIFSYRIYDLFEGYVTIFLGFMCYQCYKNMNFARAKLKKLIVSINN